jgi:hypothetical protein
VEEHGHGHHHSHEETFRVKTPQGTIVLSIFEENVPPVFRIQFEGWSVSSPIDASQISVTTQRPDGTTQLFLFSPFSDFLQSFDTIPEPHEFKVTVKVSVDGTSSGTFFFYSLLCIIVNSFLLTEYYLDFKEHVSEDHGHGHGHESAPKKKKKKTHNLSLVSSVGFTIDGLLNVPLFNTFMSQLLQTKAADLYRTKGVLAFSNQGDSKFVFQGIFFMIISYK